MRRWDTYNLDSTHINLSDARARKDVLRYTGFRVKIRKNEDGHYQVWEKDIRELDRKRYRYVEIHDS